MLSSFRVQIFLSLLLLTAQITLHNKDCAQPTVITRTMTRRQGDSGVTSLYEVYHMGGDVCKKTADEVVKLAQSLGIFVDNNCQLLPQESIANFVNSAPQAVSHIFAARLSFVAVPSACLTSHPVHSC